MSYTITSSANAKIKLLRSLRIKKFRRQSRLFLIEGGQAILLAAENNRTIRQIFYTETALKIKNFVSLLEKYKEIKQYRISQKLAAIISERDNPMPAFAILDNWQEKLPLSLSSTKRPILALEQVRDAGNLGSILRSLTAIGGTTIILIDDCVDVFSPEVCRASMGYIAPLKIYKASQAEFINCIKNSKLELTASVVQSGLDYRQLSLNKNVSQMLLMGNEQQGLSQELIDLAQHLVSIPMPGSTESLNLAVATGILLFQLYYP